MSRSNQPKTEHPRLWLCNDGRLRVAVESDLPGQDREDPAWRQVSAEDFLKLFAPVSDDGGLDCTAFGA